DNVYSIIEKDLAAQPLATAPLLSEVATALPAQPVVSAPRQKKEETLIVKAKLVFKSEPITEEELLPYQESLVAYVYDVEKVVRGNYSERRVLVMHPSFIALKKQKLDKFRIGKNYKLRLHPMEGTLWETSKVKDETGQIDLQPYMRLEDLKRHPGERTR
ncbi:MAG: hypothetical protein M3R10_08545, partial [Verrucomicrobiota bacterium]|nr:hypothetical protein [Verrucomicrobiota bacterium]